jgi:DNA polymerase (family 10)
VTRVKICGVTRLEDARLAAELGVKIPVNTDSHELRALAHMPIGVSQARRAWLTKEQILNTRPWPQIAKLLA